MRTRLCFAIAVSLIVSGAVGWTLQAAGGGLSVSGPLTPAATNGCAADHACTYDFALAPSATGTPGVDWHAYWDISPPASRAKRGWCTTEVTDLISWGPAGRAALPARTFPPAGVSAVGSAGRAVLEVDAGGRAVVPGRLSATPAWPQGLSTTTVGHGYMSVVWQGRTTRPVPLVLAAEVPNPETAASFEGGLNTAGVGTPCADVAPPGGTFLARIVPSSVRLGRTAWLELRIPRTAYRWTVSPKRLSVAEGGGTVTVSVAYAGDGLFGRGTASTPETLTVSDRYSLPLRERLRDRYLVTVTLRGPTGVRHYRLPFTVR